MAAKDNQNQPHTQYSISRLYSVSRGDSNTDLASTIEDYFHYIDGMYQAGLNTTTEYCVLYQRWHSLVN